MKNIGTILLLGIFLLVSIIMPYGNFDDIYTTRLLYSKQRSQDPDLNIGEFIFEKLLFIGGLFEQEDEDEPEGMPAKYPQPIQTIQTGFLDCYKPVIKMRELPDPIAKPTCLFKENKLAREFSPAIFHPPAVLS